MKSFIMIGQKYCYKKSLRGKYKGILRNPRRQIIANPWNLEMILFLDKRLKYRDRLVDKVAIYRYRRLYETII